MLQGMTAHYLTRSTYPLRAGETALIHAAAGGAGLMTVQMAKLCGATVIGTVGSAEKMAIAKDAGADEVINYASQDFETEVKRITNGRGVDVVYDSVGAATFTGSINSLRPRGMMVTFGQRQRPGACRLAAVAFAEGLSVPYASHAGKLHRHSRGVALARRRRS